MRERLYNCAICKKVIGLDAPAFTGKAEFFDGVHSMILCRKCIKDKRVKQRMPYISIDALREIGIKEGGA